MEYLCPVMNVHAGLKERKGEKMTQYRNVGGNSGVFAYENNPDSITVTFKDGATYLYNYSSAGMYNVETMKVLAINGKGLNSFISTTVRKNYFSKLR